MKHISWQACCTQHCQPRSYGKETGRFDDRANLERYRPEDLQSLHPDISWDLELSIWFPLGNSVLVQEIIKSLGLDEHIIGFDLVL